MSRNVMTDYCPYCNHRINQATAIEGELEEFDPHNPNIGMCAYCAEPIMQIKGKLSKIPDTFMEQIRIEAPEYYDYMMASVKALKEINEGK